MTLHRSCACGGGRPIHSNIRAADKPVGLLSNSGNWVEDAVQAKLSIPGLRWPGQGKYLLRKEEIESGKNRLLQGSEDIWTAMHCGESNIASIEKMAHRLVDSHFHTQ